jgi:hypothetical protein
MEAAAVVDDNEDRPVSAHGAGGARERRRDPVEVRVDGGSARSVRRGPDFSLTPVVETEQLVRVAMLLVVVDQPRVRRRGDDGLEAAGQLRLARVAVQHVGLVPAAHARELLHPGRIRGVVRRADLAARASTTRNTSACS